MSKPVLIIGCGNPLRSDDGLAHEVIAQLERDNADLSQQVDIEEAHQLTPEMAESASHAKRVIIVDARCGGHPGTVTVSKVQASTSEKPPGGLTHDFDPETLLSTTRMLFGAAPEMYVVTVDGENFDHGESLSPIVAAALPEIAEQVRALATALTES